MPFPEYVPTRSVSVGGAMGLESSALLKISASVKSSRPLIWAETGYRFESAEFTQVGELGSEVIFTLPRTDAQGWKDSRSNALIDVSAGGAYSHRYTVQVDFFDGDGRTLYIPSYTIGPFVLPAGDGPLDLDKVIPAGTVSGDTVSVPDSWSAAVAAAEAAARAAEAALLDSTAFVNATIEADEEGVLAAKIEAGVANPGPIRSALDTRYMVRGGGLDLLPDPFIIAHRGLSGPMPENTMAAFRAAAASGAHAIECDVVTLADGGQGVMHDGTVDRTTNGTGAVEGFTVMDWSGLVVDGGRLGGWATPLPAPFWPEVIGEFGGSYTLIGEPKLASDVALLANSIKSAGLTNHAVLYTSTPSALTAIVAAGIRAGFYWGAGAATSSAIDAKIAEGCDYLLANTGWNTDAEITLMASKNKPVWCFGILRRTDRDRLVGLGVQGIGTDETGYLARSTAVKKTDSWRNNQQGHGLLRRGVWNTNDSATISGGKLTMSAADTHDAYMVGEVSPIAAAASSYTIDIDVSFALLAGKDASDSVQLVFGCADDRSYANLNGQWRPGYAVFIRKDGAFRIGKFTNSTTYTQIGTQTTTAMTDGGTVHMRVAVTPTGITATRTDSGGFTPIVVNDTTFRGGYVHVAQTMTTSTSPAQVSNLTVT